MMPAWTLENVVAWAAQVMLLGLVGALVPKLFRIHHPRFYLWYCHILILLVVVLPFIQPLSSSAPGPAFPLSMGVSAGVPAIESRHLLDKLRPWIPWLVAAGVITRLAFFIAGVLRIRHYRKKSIPLNFPKESILSVCKLIDRDVEIAVSATEVGPVTFGWLRPMILLPATFLSLDEEAQRAILCHELIHVVRRDWLSTVLEEIIGSCLWFHPAVWWVLSETKLAREQLVDAEVVRLTSARDSYVEALLAIAQVGEEYGLLPAPLFLRKRHLTNRMRSLLVDRQTAGIPLAFSCASISTILLCALLVGFTAFPLIAATPVAELPASRTIVQASTPEVFTIEDGVTPPKVSRYVAPEYSDAARHAKVEGVVVVQAVIQADGSVAGMEVKRGLDPDLDRNAMLALQQWRFEPARRNGLPVDVKLFIEVSFQIKR